MKVISVIEDQDVIKKILKHLGLGEVKPRAPPKATGPPKTTEYTIDYSVSQLPVWDNLSRASRSNEWLYAELSACDAQAGPDYPEIHPP